VNLVDVREVRLTELTPHPLSDELFGQMTDDEFESLKADISTRGVMHPIEVDDAHRVICGSQRLRALREIDPSQTISVIVRPFDSEENIQVHLIKDNLLKRTLSPMQLFRAGERLELIYKAQASKNQESGRRGVKIPQNQKLKVRDKVAASLNTSSTTYWRLGQIMKSGNPELIEKVDSGQLSISKASEQLSFRAKPIKEQRQKDVVEFLRFNRHLNRFFKYLQTHQPESFNSYRRQAQDSLKTLKTRIDLML
jgi:hypothetical protein